MHTWSDASVCLDRRAGRLLDASAPDCVPPSAVSNKDDMLVAPSAAPSSLVHRVSHRDASRHCCPTSFANPKPNQQSCSRSKAMHRGHVAQLGLTIIHATSGRTPSSSQCSIPLAFSGPADKSLEGGLTFCPSSDDVSSRGTTGSAACTHP